MELRPFSLSDYDAVVALWRQSPEGICVGRSDTQEQITLKLTRDPDLFLVALEDRKIVGTVIGGFDGRRGIIYHLAVDRDFRNQGLGRLLMEEVERRLASKGCLRAYLLVKAENLDVVEFYRKLGWDMMTTLIMGKNLDE